MRNRYRASLLFLAAWGGLASSSQICAAQEARYFSLGLSAGPAAIQPRFRGDWEFGPFVGGRLEWGSRGSAFLMLVDAQPFRARASSAAGEFRAVYFLPSYKIGGQGGGLSLGLGGGLFDFEGGSVPGGTEFGFVSGASGSFRLSGSFSAELGWKRINNVNGLSVNVWSLQLVRRWRL